MSIIYKVVQDDTFSLIARKQYGDDTLSSLIAKANPGVQEPLTAGTTIAIPVLPGAPQDAIQQAVSDEESEVSVLIDDERFRFWERIRIVQSLDSMSIAEFSAPMDSSRFEFRETFRPFTYRDLEVTVGGNPLFTGTMLTPNPVVTPDSSTVSVSGYALPGVLNDCTAPAGAYPLEFNNQNLRDIAATLAAPFGINIEFLSDPGPVFERVALDPNKKVLTFLADLAKQRNLVMSNTPRGALLFWNSIETGNPVANLRQGVSPLLSVQPFFNPQDYHSHITGLQSVVVGGNGSQFTVKNSKLEGVIRPTTFKAADAEGGAIKQATEAKAGRMFGNMASYSITVDTWRDPLVNLWAPNTLINLIAPDAMVYNNYTFVIRSVEFERDRASEIAKLNLVIPGSFNGQIPEALPWDE